MVAAADCQTFGDQSQRTQIFVEGTDSSSGSVYKEIGQI